MGKYAIRRILLMIPTVFLVAFIAFVVTHLMPGDVVLIKLEGAAAYEEEDLERLRAELGLDKSYGMQLVDWLWGVARFDLGNSLWSEKPVMEEIGRRLPVTLELAALAFVLSTILGVLFGVVAAVRQDTAVDHGVRILAVGGLSFPDFWVGTLVILLPLLWFNFAFSSVYTPPWEDFGNNMRLMLPAALVLGFRGAASVMRLTRTTLLETLRQDYVRTARAKGLQERVVIFGHALRNALIPVVTVLGTRISRMLGGTVIIEMIFQLPGVGRYILQSITQRDLTVVQGTIMMMAVAFLVANLLVDLSYGWLDPRIRYS